jgi:hypothetical protein
LVDYGKLLARDVSIELRIIQIFKIYTFSKSEILAVITSKPSTKELEMKKILLVLLILLTSATLVFAEKKEIIVKKIKVQ